MFDQTFVDGVGKTNKSWTVTISFAVEFVAVGVMILIPLIWTDVLPKATLVNFLTAPAPPPPPPPPPPPTPVVKVHVIPRQFTGQLTAPREIPHQVAMITEEALPPSSIGVAVGGVEGGIPGGALSGLVSSIGQAPPPPPPPPPKVEVVKPKIEGPQRVSSGVQAAKLIKKVTPSYPAIAKSARIQGQVVLQAYIAKDGTVQKLTLVSSTSPLLIQAAMDAVKQWVYQPTLLNTEPVEVLTEITVNFSLQ
jgi:protein TonB